MRNIGARVSDELYERLTAFTEDGDDGDDEITQSDAIRKLLKRGLEDYDREQELQEIESEYEERIEELESEYEERIADLKAKRDDLSRQLQATNRRVDDHQELQEYVAEQRELDYRRERREDRRAHAGVLTRAKWWLVGMPRENNAE